MKYVTRRTSLLMCFVAIFLIIYEICAIAEERLDDAVSSVVFFKSDGQSDKYKFGTGFFLLGDKGAYLITVAHVARSLTLKATATIRSEGDKPFTFLITDLTPLKLLPPWQYSDKADLAVLRIDIPDTNEALKKNLKKHFLPISVLMKELIAPSRDITLTIIGFPLALGTKDYFSPISKETKSASGLVEIKDKDEKKVFISFVMQDPSVGGFSGAPIFDTGLPYSTVSTGLVVRNRMLQLVGIARATLSDDTGGKLGVAIPSYFLSEMLE